MAKEYIEKEAAILELLDKGQCSHRYRLGEEWELNFDEIREAIANVPAADVRENVKAEWIPFTRFGEWVNDGHGVLRPQLLDAGFKCSACGTMKHTRTKWCPDCGAEIVLAAVQVDWMYGGAEDG